MNDFKYNYLKYKKKYVSLKEQLGGVKCNSEYFTQHNGECWHDSLQMVLLFCNNIGDRLKHIIDLNSLNDISRSNTIEEILKTQKKNKFLLPINFDYDYEGYKGDDLQKFGSILKNYIYNMVKRYKIKLSPIKLSPNRPDIPQLKRNLSECTGISSAMEAINIYYFKKEDKHKMISTKDYHGAREINSYIVLQVINYFFQNDTNIFINAIIYNKSNINELNISLLDKFNGININVINHAVCLFKCEDKYMFYDDNGVSDTDRNIHAKEFDWYTLIKDNIYQSKENLLDIILTELQQISKQYFKRYKDIISIICIYEDTFSDEDEYYFKLLNNYNYFNEFYNTDTFRYKRLYERLDNDNIFNMIINKYYSTERIYDDELKRIKSSLNNLEEVYDIFRNSKYNIKMLALYSNEIRNDRVIIKKLFLINFRSFEYVSEELRNNKDFIKELFNLNLNVLFYVYEELKNDKDFIKELVKINFNVLHYVSKELKNDNKFIKELVKIKFQVLYFVSEELKNNKEFIRELVEINLNIFQYASERLKDNEPFIKELIKINPDIFQYASERLKDNETLIKELIKINPIIFLYASERLKDNEQFIKKLVEKTPPLFSLASDRLKADEPFIKELVEINPDIFYNISNKLKYDIRFIKELIKINPYIFNYISDKLQDDKEFIKELVGLNSDVFKYVSLKLKDDDFIKELVIINTSILRFVSGKKLKNNDFIKELVKINPAILLYASDILKDDETFINELIEINPIVLQYASDRLKKL